MSKSIFIWGAIGLGGLSIAAMSIPVSARVQEQKEVADKGVQRMDLSAYSSKPPEQPLDLLFIHHSCGGQLLAAPGPTVGENCILESDPNGGNLRALLEENAYRVHEASYGSRIGQNTDVFDWLPKFRNQMDEILRCDRQDVLYAGDQRNKIVLFKSCFPNNAFRGQGTPPGNADGPELTVWNAKAAYNALLAEFRKRPDVLFVCLTAPPLAPGKEAMPLWRRLVQRVKGIVRGDDFDRAEGARLARQFNSWLCATDGWLKDYNLKNVVVFDYYDILTDHGASDLSQYATSGGANSHPSSAGNQKAAKALVPFLNQSIQRAFEAPASVSAR